MGKKPLNKKSSEQRKPKRASNQRVDDSDGEVENPQAWGSSKRNYYQEGDQEYSSISQEEQQAQQIYENQHLLLNDPNYYANAPEEDSDDSGSQHSSEEGEGQQQTIDKSQIINEIKWALNCQKHLTEVSQYLSDEKILALYQKLIDIYLVIAIALKEFKVSYAQHHPMVQELTNTKQHLLQVRRKVQQLQKCSRALQTRNDHHQSKRNILLQSNAKDVQARNKTNKNSAVNNKKMTITQKPKFDIVNESQARLASQMILKNKGLMKKRKKTDGNSRLKLRKRYEKAQSKQRAMGHFIRENPGRGYEGQTNIRTGKIASVKLK